MNPQHLDAADEPTASVPAKSAPDTNTCAHCGLDATSTSTTTTSANGEVFCCEGCATVFAIIHDQGLGEYYALRDTLGDFDEGAGSQRRRENEDAFERFDDPMFKAAFCENLGENQWQTELYLDGVHCAACVWLVEHALQKEPGLEEGRLDFARRVLRVQWHGDKTKLSRIAQILKRVGYDPHPLDAADSRTQRRREERMMFMRIGVGLFAAGNTMLMAFALYAGWFTGIDTTFVNLFRWASLVIALPAVTFSAWPFYRAAWAGLRHGVLHMDLPISIGIAAGFFGGLYATLSQSGETYFESITALVFLVLLGRFIQLRQQHHAASTSELLFAMAPSTAHKLVPDGQADGQELVAVHSLVPKDRVLVFRGEKIPSDGIVSQGRALLDTAFLTGEFAPLRFAVGDRVYGGATNLGETIEVEITQCLKDSRVAGIAQSVERARTERTPFLATVDRLSGAFVLTVLILASFTLWRWWQLDSQHAIHHTIAVLVVACPCALGLATPMTLSAGLAKAARLGILFRSGSALERLGQLTHGTLFIDKTGTLTSGHMHLCHYRGDARYQPVILALEEGAQHPVASALRQAFGQQVSAAAEHIEEHAGHGVSGLWHGKSVRLGTLDFVQGTNGRKQVPEDWAELSMAWSSAGQTPVWFGVDGQVVALMAVGDSLREESPEVLDNIRSLGFDVRLLSGDRQRVARAIGQSLGLLDHEILAECTPEEKLRILKNTQGPKLMVGDGVNDAAALAAADVGIAVHGSAETCLSAADVFLQRPGLLGLYQVLAGSRRAFATIKVTIIISLFYNLIGAGLGVMGYLHPIVAAILMPLSSLMVVSIAYRFRFVSKESLS